MGQVEEQVDPRIPLDNHTPLDMINQVAWDNQDQAQEKEGRMGHLQLEQTMDRRQVHMDNQLKGLTWGLRHQEEDRRGLNMGHPELIMDPLQGLNLDRQGPNMVHLQVHSRVHRGQGQTMAPLQQAPTTAHLREPIMDLQDPNMAHHQAQELITDHLLAPTSEHLLVLALGHQVGQAMVTKVVPRDMGHKQGNPLEWDLATLLI
jgi:hypothetical protein